VALVLDDAVRSRVAEAAPLPAATSPRCARW